MDLSPQGEHWVMRINARGGGLRVEFIESEEPKLPAVRSIAWLGRSFDGRLTFLFAVPHPKTFTPGGVGEGTIGRDENCLRLMHERLEFAVLNTDKLERIRQIQVVTLGQVLSFKECVKAGQLDIVDMESTAPHVSE
ncbi:MAG: hypothetical protein M3N48_12835 [Verrucomicrobiota bacterium]|nr:hypothetical protein [Verrucomicrobiota bacterium]